MFNKELYPPPQWLVQKMIAPLDLSDAYVLDPSAGTGNILDVIAEKYNDGHRYHKANLYAVEIEPELRAVLASKGYPIVRRRLSGLHAHLALHTRHSQSTLQSGD